MRTHLGKHGIGLNYGSVVNTNSLARPPQGQPRMVHREGGGVLLHTHRDSARGGVLHTQEEWACTNKSQLKTVCYTHKDAPEEEVGVSAGYRAEKGGSYAPRGIGRKEHTYI